MIMNVWRGPGRPPHGLDPSIFFSTVAAADSARREGGVAGASLPPRMGVNARESERKQVARDGGVNIWNDIAGGVKEKLQSAAATLIASCIGAFLHA